MILNYPKFINGVGYPLPKKRIDANDIEYIDDMDTVRHGNPKISQV